MRFCSEMAMNGAVILTKEDQDLQASNEKKLQKRRYSARQIDYIEGIFTQEARSFYNIGIRPKKIRILCP